MLKNFLKSLKKRNTELARLELVIDYRFQRSELMNLALIHRSYTAPEGSDLEGKNNERLEFLGDSVLNMVVTEFLYRTYPGRREGELSKIKAKLVSGASLSRCAGKWNLGAFLKISKGERKAGGAQKASILEDAFEAVIGAVYLDGGIEPCRSIIKRELLSNISDIINDQSLANHKSLLLEAAQAQALGAPVYVFLAEEGLEHSKMFRMGVQIQGKLLGEGIGTSKKKAEQKAAEQALKQLEEKEFSEIIAMEVSKESTAEEEK
jgi:ribonuclease-3